MGGVWAGIKGSISSNTSEKNINLGSQHCRTSDNFTKELMVPFPLTKCVLSSQGFDVMPPLLGVSFSQTVHFVVIM